MKKYLPIILFVFGLLVVICVVYFVSRENKAKDNIDGQEEETALVELSFSQKPYISLTPTIDGHYLKFRIDKLNIDNLKSFDYELLYETATGLTQGVPGEVEILDKKNFETDLLLGSESSGKFRYDEGVEKGSITVWLRDSEGRLLSKQTLNFNLEFSVDTLALPSENFKYTLDRKSEDYFVVMETWGVPEGVKGEVSSGPFGIFTSGSSKYPGKVEIEGSKIFLYNNGWKAINGNQSEDIGVFLGSD